MNMMMKPGILKRIVSLGVEIAAVAVALSLLIPLFATQAGKGEVNATVCYLTISLIGFGLLILVCSFLFFRYSKVKFKTKKIVDTIASLIGRLLCLGGLIAGQFAGESSALPWLATSVKNANWFGIALFALFALYSIKDIATINNDPEAALYEAFEQAEDFVNQGFQSPNNGPVIEEVKEKASDDDIIEAEVVDKED